MTARSGRIAIVSHTHPSVTKGGAEISAYTLFKGIQALGREVLFIAACPDQDRRKLNLGSSDEIALFFDPRDYDHFYHIGPPLLADQLAAALVKAGCSLANFHHFLNYGINSLRRLRRQGVSTALTLHEFLAICNNHGQMVTRPERRLCDTASGQRCAQCFPERDSQQFAIRRESFLHAFAGVSAFIAPSAFLAERFVRWGIAAERISVVENGLVGAPQQPAASSSKGPSEPWVFGFFGQINPFKGVDVLLDASEMIAKQPELRERVRVYVHGTPVGQSAEIINRMQSLSDHTQSIRYMGAYENHEVRQLMTACDYVVVPSRWWENSPVVIQEAYSAGRPVIASGIGGMAEKVIDGCSGLHFKVGDAADLARAITTAADPNIFARLREGVPSTIDGVEMARRYLEKLDSLQLSSQQGVPTSVTQVKRIPQSRPRGSAHSFKAHSKMNSALEISTR